MTSRGRHGSMNFVAMRRVRRGGRTSGMRVGQGVQEKEGQKGGLLTLWRPESLELVSSEPALLLRQVDGVAKYREGQVPNPRARGRYVEQPELEGAETHWPVPVEFAGCGSRGMRSSTLLLRSFKSEAEMR